MYQTYSEIKQVFLLFKIATDIDSERLCKFCPRTIETSFREDLSLCRSVSMTVIYCSSMFIDELYKKNCLFCFCFKVEAVVATTVAAAAILLANVPREGETGEKVDEGVDAEEDEGEDVGGEVDVIETRMNTGSKDTAFTKERCIE